MGLVTTTATDNFNYGDWAIGGFLGLLQSVPQFPLQLSATRDLLNFANSFPTDSVPTLAANILSTDTTINITTGLGQYLYATENFEVSIDDEIIFVKSRSGDVLSGCIRGAEFTTPASHLLGASTQLLITAKSHNQIAAEVIEIEQYINCAYEVAIASTTRGNMTVPHGLSRAPRRAAIQMTSAGLVYWQSPRFDSVNLYLVASDDALSCIVEVWP